MTGKVIDFPGHVDGYDGITCPCGEAWFELSGSPVAKHGAVTFGLDGSITGYHGTPVCIPCGQPAALTPRGGHLT